MEKQIREAIIARLQKITRDYEATRMPKKSDQKLTPKQKKIQKFLDTKAFGCNQVAVNRLVSLLEGFTVAETPADRLNLFPNGVVVVLLANNNGHNYPIGLPLVTRFNGATNGSAFSTGGGLGNNLPEIKSDIRLATDAEITQLTDAQLSAAAMY